MSSRFVYYRPRGVPGNYIVQVVLDLADTETGEVWVARNREYHCGHCGRQAPVTIQAHPASGTSSLVEYIIGNIIADDQITIIIRDENVVPQQETSHTATMRGFYHKALPYTHWGGKVWSEKQIRLNAIDLYDLDYANKPFDRLCQPRDSRTPSLPDMPALQFPARSQNLLPTPAHSISIQLGDGSKLYFSPEKGGWVIER